MSKCDICEWECVKDSCDYKKHENHRTKKVAINFPEKYQRFWCLDCYAYFIITDEDIIKERKE